MVYDANGTIVGRYEIDNGGAFPLGHNQTARIDNIPIGTSWVVAEGKHDGYASSADSNRGTIGAGANYSRWKNHRSYEPPIPKTGYGDGTTIKTGLFASLGVFLASAIGSIFQKRSMKKKKRGGNHAAE